MHTDKSFCSTLGEENCKNIMPTLLKFFVSVKWPHSYIEYWFAGMRTMYDYFFSHIVYFINKKLFVKPLSLSRSLSHLKNTTLIISIDKVCYLLLLHAKNKLFVYLKRLPINKNRIHTHATRTHPKDTQLHTILNMIIMRDAAQMRSVFFFALSLILCSETNIFLHAKKYVTLFNNVDFK